MRASARRRSGTELSSRIASRQLFPPIDAITKAHTGKSAFTGLLAAQCQCGIHLVVATDSPRLTLALSPPTRTFARAAPFLPRPLPARRRAQPIQRSIDRADRRFRR